MSSNSFWKSSSERGRLSFEGAVCWSSSGISWSVSLSCTDCCDGRALRRRRRWSVECLRRRHLLSVDPERGLRERDLRELWYLAGGDLDLEWARRQFGTSSRFWKAENSPWVIAQTWGRESGPWGMESGPYKVSWIYRVGSCPWMSPTGRGRRDMAMATGRWRGEGSVATSVRATPAAYRRARVPTLGTPTLHSEPFRRRWPRALWRGGSAGRASSPWRLSVSTLYWWTTSRAPHPGATSRSLWSGLRPSP